MNEGLSIRLRNAVLDEKLMTERRWSVVTAFLRFLLELLGTLLLLLFESFHFFFSGHIARFSTVITVVEAILHVY